MNYEQKEVYFDKYCKICKHEKTEEFEEPCHNCLNAPYNTNSHKPVYWEEKSRRNKDENKFA